MAITATLIKSATNLKTPQFLKLGLQVTWAMSVLLMSVAISGVQVQRQTVKTIGKDAAPSVINAQRIKDSIADIDANVANELLAKPGQNASALKGFSERQTKLSGLLIDAAQNITYGERESAPIKQIQLELGNYMMLVQRARDFHKLGNAPEALIAYRASAKLIDDVLLPKADELDKVNLEELDKQYDAQRLSSFSSLALILICGFGLIGVLVTLQLFLTQRTRRTLNPLLLVATILAIGSLIDTTRVFLSTSNNLKIAKEDAFHSLHALRQGRAIAYSANAAESRYLLDRLASDTHERAFFDFAHQVAKLPVGMNWSELLTAAQYNRLPSEFKGFIADELNNITFSGEREAAVKTLETFGAYYQIDANIRRLVRAGKYEEAIALCIGTNPGQSNWAFEEFKAAHSKTMDINQNAFDRAIQSGFNDLSNFELKMPIVMGAIALLALFGLRPRLREYLL